jgi:hypothetical protein
VADEVQQIDALLGKHGSPMKGLGNVFVAAGRKYGVDPRLVVGIAGAESNLGKYAYHPYNAWGWGGRAGHTFGSWEQSIATITKGLRDGYVGQGRTTPAAIVSKYAPGSDGNDEAQWVANVGSFMKELGADPGASMSVRPSAGARVPTAPPSFKLPDIGPSAFASVPSSGLDDMLIAAGPGLNPDAQVRNLVMSGLLDAKPWKPPPLQMPTLGTAGGKVPMMGGAVFPAGKVGKVSFASSANRAGVSVNPAVTNFVRQIAGRFGPITVGTGTNHNQFVSGTNNTRQSDHWRGNAVDIPASGHTLTRLGHDALIAAGMPWRQAEKAGGGLYQVGKWQVIFNTTLAQGGNHWNHLHVGLRG